MTFIREKLTIQEQRRRESAAASAKDFGLNDLRAGIKGGIGNLKNKAEDLGGEAAGKALDAAASLFVRFKKNF